MLVLAAPTSLPLLSDSRSVLATLSSPPSFLSSQTLWQIWQELSSLSSCFIRLQWVPGHSFLSRNDAADELARQGALLAPSVIPCSLSPLIYRIHSSLSLDWRRTVSSKFFDTQVPSIFTEKLVIPRHARCLLSRLRCNGHSLLLCSDFSKIRQNREFFLQCLRTLVSGHLSSYSALFSYGLCAAHSLASFCFFTTSGPSPGKMLGFWGSMVFCHAPIPRKGSRNINNNNDNSMR